MHKLEMSRKDTTMKNHEANQVINNSTATIDTVTHWSGATYRVIRSWRVGSYTARIIAAPDDSGALMVMVDGDILTTWGEGGGPEIRSTDLDDLIDEAAAEIEYREMDAIRHDEEMQRLVYEDEAYDHDWMGSCYAGLVPTRPAAAWMD